MDIIGMDSGKYSKSSSEIPWFLPIIMWRCPVKCPIPVLYLHPSLYWMYLPQKEPPLESLSYQHIRTQTNILYIIIQLLYMYLNIWMYEIFPEEKAARVWSTWAAAAAHKQRNQKQFSGMSGWCVLVLLFVFLFWNRNHEGDQGMQVKPLVLMKAEPASIVVVLVQGK